MRVISGIYKGKYLKGFDIEGTRPTMDRIKESLFGMIQNDIQDSICLDLFAGSGSLGIEALSNGAKKCYFNDSNNEMIKILKENLQNIENYIVSNKNHVSFLDNIGEKVDIVFLDPPYKMNLVTPSIKKILNNDLLNKGGLIICEYEEENIACNLKVIKEKNYGSKKIIIYKNEF